MKKKIKGSKVGEEEVIPAHSSIEDTRNTHSMLR